MVGGDFCWTGLRSNLSNAVGPHRVAYVAFRFVAAFFGFFFRVEGSPAGGGGVFSIARTISSKLPEIGGTVVSA